MLVLTPKYGSQIDLDLIKKQKDKTKEPLINHRLTLDLTTCKTIKEAYLTFLDNKNKYILGYKPKNAEEINKFVKSLGLIDTLDVSWIDVSELKSLRECFLYCKTKHIIGLEKWDVSNCQGMYNMFYGCKNLESIGDMSEWDVSNCQDMYNMFYKCEKLESIDLSRWNVSKFERVDGMFNNCKNLKNIGDISGWDVSNVKNLDFMFRRCEKLESIDLSRWNVSNVKFMYYMFAECYNLNAIGDISGWDVSNVKNMEFMFNDCEKLKSVGDLERWNLHSYANTRNMFLNSGITSLPSWYTKK